MIASKSPARLTYADYAEASEEERWELLNGELLMAPAPNMEHQSVQAETGWRLQTFVKAGDLGRVFYAPTDVVLSEHDVVQPDLLLYAKHGVREYWLLSPEAGSAWVFELDGGSFRETGTYSRDETLVSPTLAGFALELGDIFK